MNTSRRKEIKVGIVTLIAIVLFIAGITIGNQISVSVDYQKISLRFPNSGGIDPGAPVFVNGVKRGKVLSIDPDAGSVLVMVQIDNVKDFKEDVQARLGILEITGGKKIDINPGFSEIAFKSEDEIKGITSPDMGEMVAMLGEMGADAKVLLKKLDTIASAASRLLASEESYARLDRTIENTSEIVSVLHSFVTNNVKDLEIAVHNMKSITVDLKDAIEKYEPKAENLINKLDLTVDETRTLIKNADGAIANANNLIDELTKFKMDIKDSNGLAGKLIYDKDFAERLDSTFNTLNAFILMVKEHGININARLGTRP